ncbi:MAG TPA: tRNA pseudouridine(55) synthase TruB [Opitutales bacterium]|nr:tRNA pseudouridine(55) synthase TruB [Opitutales bacterium]
MPQTDQPFDGILLIDKPKGITSHDVVDRVRHKLHMKRIGHAGTLDPMATGLIIILVGKATKASQYLMGLDKVYEGTILLGKNTNTHDAEGTVILERPVPTLSEEQITAFLKTFEGDQYQTPPMFSAKKKDGVPLYKLARKGREVEREARIIHISSFKLDAWKEPDSIDFTISCTKGTYVRTIANDLGEKIGCGAHLTALNRTDIEKFRIEDSIPLDEFENLDVAEIQRILIPQYRAIPSSVLK